MVSSSLSPGTLLNNGCYRIEKVLGSGGYGITYLARDINLDKLVAIKEFFPKALCERDSDTSHVNVGLASNMEIVDQLRKKFIKEARNLVKLDFPGIIRILGAFEANGTAYYVMDYIEGASLSVRVREGGPLDKGSAIDYIVQVGRTLEFVHSHRINHLDVKPANILVRRNDNRAILIDFGLAKQYDKSGNQTSTTPTGLSHGYAPIEQYTSTGIKEFSPTTDIYSLAATLYYLLTGLVPPQASDLVESDLEFPPSFPDSRLIPIIRKAMSPRRNDRYASMDQFIRDLLKYDNPVSPKINKPYFKTGPGKVLLTLLIIGGLTIGGALTYYLYFRPSKACGFIVKWVDDITPQQKEAITELFSEMKYLEEGYLTFDNNDTINIPGFYISRYEVSQKLWKAIMGFNPSANGRADNRPVENVTAQECDEFVRRLSRLCGRNFNLPTENQWDYAFLLSYEEGSAVHYGSPTDTPTGWFADNSGGNAKYRGEGGYVNKAGLYDMSGNVAEWILADTKLYENDSRMYRRIMGGSYDTTAEESVEVLRYLPVDEKAPDVGLRVVLNDFY